MRSRDSGIAVVAALGVMAVVSVLVLGALFTASVQYSISANDTRSTQAYYVAQAGLQKYKTMAYRTFRDMVQNPAKYDGIYAGLAEGCATLFKAGLDLDRDGAIGAGDLVAPSDGSEAGPEVQETITLPDGTTGTYWISLLNGGGGLRARGQYANASTRVYVGFNVESGGAWNNAIFAGSGQTGNGINGNAAVFGSISVLGSSLAPTATAIDFSGSAGVFNSYNQNGNGEASVDLSSFNIAASTRNTADLCAKVRVFYGKVLLEDSNKASLGTSTKKLKAVYVGDPSTQVTAETRTRTWTETTGPVAPHEVSTLDLANPTPFPNLDNDATPTNRQRLVAGSLNLLAECPSLLTTLQAASPIGPSSPVFAALPRMRATLIQTAGPNYSISYIADTSVTVVQGNTATISVTTRRDPDGDRNRNKDNIIINVGVLPDGVSSSNLTLVNPDNKGSITFAAASSAVPGTYSIALSASSSGPTSGTPYMTLSVVAAAAATPELSIKSSTPAFACPSSFAPGAPGPGIYYQPGATGQLYIQGVVALNGANFNLLHNVEYTGRGNIFAQKVAGLGGYVNIGANLMPAPGSANQYPENSVIGITAEADLLLSKTSATNKLMLGGAFYAQNQVIVEQQATLAGTIVTNYFDLTQVPEIAQIPNLASNLPPMMPGGGQDGNYIFTIAAWERR